MKTPSIKIDHDRREVKVNGKDCYLPPAEYSILRALMGPPAKALTREQLAIAIGHKSESIEICVSGRTIDQHIHRLREKIGSHSIETIQRHGYRLSNHHA